MMRHACTTILLLLLMVGALPAQWQRATKPQSLFDVKSVSVRGAEVTVGVIDYLVQTGGGIWQSPDTGNTWTRTLSMNSVESFMQEGANLCATTTYKGILFSSDAGLSWQQAAIVGGGQTYSMLLSYRGTLYSGVLGGYPVANGVVRSTDLGATWSPSGSGISGEGIVALAGFDSVMLAGAFHVTNPATSGGVYRSTDGGLTWSATSLTGTTVSAFASNGSMFFAGTDRGVYRSTDFGLTWTLTNSGMPTQGVSGLVAEGTTIYAGTKGRGVYKSTDNGDRWSAFSDGLTDQNVRTLVSNGFLLFAGTSGGLWRVTVKTPVFPPRDLVAIAGPSEVWLQWHGTGDFKILRYVVYGGTAPAPTTPLDTVSNGNGNVFATTIRGLTAGTTYYFRVAALDSAGGLSEYSNEVSAVPIGYGCIAGTVSSPSGGLKGVTVKLLDTLSTAVADLVTDANGQYVFSQVIGGAYDVMIVEPVGYTAAQNPVRVIVVPPDTSKADFPLAEFVTGSRARGVWYWKHQFDVALGGSGTAQESTEALLKYVQAITTSYATYFPMYQSATTLAAWQSILSPTLCSPFRSWAEAELGALLLNLASYKVGQYSIATKDDRTVGDVALYVSGLTLDADSTNDLYAAFLAWECNMNILIGAGLIPKGEIVLGVGKDDLGAVPETFELLNNYPNPFNPTTGIRYQVAGHAGQSSSISVRVYDVLGREVATLVNGIQAPGTYDVTWNAAGLSSGIYLCRFEATPLSTDAGQRFVQTMKMLLLK